MYVSEGGIVAGIVSDMTGCSATTSIVMMVLAAPMVCHLLKFSHTNIVNDAVH